MYSDILSRRDVPDTFSDLRKVREISNARRWHLLLPASRLAWSAAINSAKEIDFTVDLLDINDS